MRPALHYDVIVLGCGVAGLTAASRLAEGGARVCVLAKGVGSTHLAPGTVDVLGHDAAGVVESPASALPGFIAAKPDHPYALVGADSIESSLEWFAGLIERGPQPGYRYVGGLERNHLLPTAVGALRPSALVAETMAEGDGRAAPVCVVGIRALRDFHASLCAGNLRRAGIAARAVELDLDVGRVEVNSLGLARKLDDRQFRAGFAAQLAMLLRGDERVALPAVLGLLDPHAVWSELRNRLGRPVFEVPTLPPSVPGMRVSNALVAGLRAVGGRLIVGAEVQSAEREGERVVSVRAHTSGRDTVFGARWVVVATGGFASGALELGSDWQARERAFGFTLRGVPAPGEPRFSADYFAEHPMSRVGIAVDSSLHVADVENVFVAGAALPGAVPWHEGSGEGIALSTGSFVARSVLEREGATATA